MTPKPENPKTHAKKHVVCNGPHLQIFEQTFQHPILQLVNLTTTQVVHTS